MIKNLLPALLLISPTSFADWGDVYYCQMTNWIITTLEGFTTNLTPLMRFQFKLDKTTNAMVYGKGSYFNGRSNKLLEGASDPSVEFWKTQKEGSMSYFHEGRSRETYCKPINTPSFWFAISRIRVAYLSPRPQLKPIP